jgi:hypothetical protein
VIWWLERHGFDASAPVVDRIFQAAKQADRCLTEQELEGLARAH